MQLRCFALLFVAAAILAGCSREVTVGAVVSRTGAAKAPGERVQHGLELAAAMANREAGFFGRRVRLIFRDDGTRPEDGARAAIDLIERERVPVIIGAVSSSVTFAIARVCQERKTVMLSPSASAPGLTGMGSYVFRIYPSDMLEGKSMADFARDLGLTRVVTFAVSDAWGRGLADAFAEQLAAAPLHLVARFDFPEGDVAAIDGLVARAHALGPDGIFIAAYASDTGEIARRIRAAGLDAVILGTSTVTPDLARQSGSAVENLVFPLPSFDPQSPEPEVATFVSAYRTKFAEVPDNWAAHGYDALNVILAAVDRAKSTDPDAISRVLRATENYQGAAGRIAFDAHGDVVRYPRIWVVRDGDVVPYERFIENGGILPVPRR